MAQQGFEYVPERPNATNFIRQKWGWRGTLPGAQPQQQQQQTQTQTQTQTQGKRVVGAAAAAAGFAISHTWHAVTRLRVGSGACLWQLSTLLYAHSRDATGCAGPNQQACSLAPHLAGAWAELEVDTRPNPAAFGSGSSPSETVVWLSHLRSYEGMGTARIECVSGCSCVNATLDGTWSQRASVVSFTRFLVRRGERLRMWGCVRHVWEEGAVDAAQKGSCAPPQLPLIAYICITRSKQGSRAGRHSSRAQSAPLCAHAGFKDSRTLPTPGDGPGPAAGNPAARPQGGVGGKKGREGCEEGKWDVCNGFPTS